MKLPPILDRIAGRMGLFYYTRVYSPVKAFTLRRKARVRVIFVITEIGVWKTESLYLAMQAHPRFEPVLRVLPTPENPQAQAEVTAYLNRKHYPYRCIGQHEPLQRGFKADVIFYQKPYKWVYYPAHAFTKNKNALLAYVSYGLHNILSDYICNQPFHNYLWHYYFENSDCAAETARIMDNGGRNIRITGLPMADAYGLPTSAYVDRWKPQAVRKTRLIWAPHYSFVRDEVLAYSTFLTYADVMLQLARKYESQVQFVFKPHPLLKPSLTDYWGAERAEAYFAAWDALPNAQVETGSYVDLFMTSDAMIHDCSSFTIEYQYARRPVLYLLRGSAEQHGADLNTFAREAFEAHYMGYSPADVETFIQHVVSHTDPMEPVRQAYYQKYLHPVHGKSACENIIHAILGE